MCWSPLSPPCWASLPHVLESSGYPAVPNPILESQLLQTFWLLATIPILALECLLSVHRTLNPSLLQLGCKEARGPMSFFHVLRPSEEARHLPSAISEYRDLAWWLMTTDLSCWICLSCTSLQTDKHWTPCILLEHQKLTLLGGVSLLMSDHIVNQLLNI